MITYLFSWEFWRNIGVLFAASCVLGPVLYLGVKLLIALVTMSGSSSSKSDDEGCGGCFFFIVVIGVMYWIGGGVLHAIQDAGWFQLKSEQLAESERKIANVATFAKESPLLYEHYNSLRRFEMAEQEYVNTLQSELSQITTDIARKPLRTQIAQVKKDISVLQEKQRRIEDLANRLYFARYMQNLGVNIDDSELQREVRQTQTETERIISENEHKIQARKK